MIVPFYSVFMYAFLWLKNLNRKVRKDLRKEHKEKL